MKIERKIIKIRDLVKGYINKGDDGVEGYFGNLDIRPPYQREFIYENDKQQAVIDSVLANFPLGIMYWVNRGDGTYEILDGQQRTLSICKFFNRDFSVVQNDKPKYFDGLTEEEKANFLNYELDVYVCTGNEREKLAWFERINVQGIPLSKQELRNASYTGPWLSDAKFYFSKVGAPAEAYTNYLSGKKNRQEWLEKAIAWKSEADSEKNKEDIGGYMAEHQQDENAKELWHYFFKVMNWVKEIFIEYRKEMKSVEWGILFNKYSEKISVLMPYEVEKQVKQLMMDDEVKNKKGIYYYIFNKDEKHLNLRTFTVNQKRKQYEVQNGYCNNKNCPHGKEKVWDINEMEADHITPWSQGGKTDLDNLQLLCKDCNRRKSSK